MKLSFFLFLCASQKPNPSIEDIKKIKSSLPPDILALFQKEHSAIEEAALRSFANYENKSIEKYNRILYAKTRINKLQQIRPRGVYDYL